MMKTAVFLSLLIVIGSCIQRDVVTDFAFVGDFTSGLEGPAVNHSGYLYFVNPQKNGTIGRLSPEGEFELYVDSLPNGSVANGIRFNQRGKMFLADYTNHNVLTIDPASRAIGVLAFDSTMNQPNDLAIRSDGMLFASDPNWAESTGQLWRIDPKGRIDRLESGMGTTNGVEVAPGDTLLYVNESVQRKVWVYDINDAGDISNKRLLIDFTDHGMDGMRTDVKGNLYIARYGKGVIAVVSPMGELLKEIKLKGQKPTNIAFGGPDGRTCYVTCQDRGYIETFRADHPGRSWSLRP